MYFKIKIKLLLKFYNYHFICLYSETSFKQSLMGTKIKFVGGIC